MPPHRFPQAVDELERRFGRWETDKGLELVETGCYACAEVSTDGRLLRALCKPAQQLLRVRVEVTESGELICHCPCGPGPCAHVPGLLRLYARHPARVRVLPDEEPGGWRIEEF